MATKAADERRLDPLGVLEPTEAEQALIDAAVAALRDRGRGGASRGPAALWSGGQSFLASTSRQ